MPFKPCPTPESDALAVRGPTDNISRFLYDLHEHHMYWSRKELNTHADIDLGLGILAKALHRELFQSTAWFRMSSLRIERSRQLIERDRRRALGTLAVSSLLQRLLKPNVSYDDAIGMGDAAFAMGAIVVDTMKGPYGMPLDHRVHIMPEEATELLGDFSGTSNDCWYHDSTMFVHRIRPVQLSKSPTLSSS